MGSCKPLLLALFNKHNYTTKYSLLTPEMAKKGGNPQNFNNPEKAYKGTLGVRVAPHLFDYVNSKPDKTDWLREAIAEKYEREVNPKGDQAIA